MIYTVYKITNILNNKIYVGVHKTENPYDSYIGSGKIIKDAIAKHGKHNFKKEVMFIFDTLQEALDKEREIVTFEFVENTNTYNLALGGGLGGKNINGFTFYGHKHSDETKAKIAKNSVGNLANSGRLFDDQHKRKIGESNAIALKGKPKSEEHKRKIRETLLKKRQKLGDGVAGNITDFESGDGRFEPCSPNQ